jgi:hypothetical protein
MRIPNLVAGALAALALSSAPAAAQGRWLVAYPEAKDPMYAAMQQMFAQQDILSAMIEPLNEFFPVSRDVTVELAECGRAGAFYDDSRPAVQMCYELLVQLAESMMSDDGDDQLFVGAFAFILLHQVGHAFVDLMDLPVQVPTEEAADQLAAVMVGMAEDDGLETVAEGVVALDEMEVDWENPGAGRSALRGRRLGNLLCLLYGSDPDTYEYLVEEGHLTAEQANTCPQTFEDVGGEWVEMLEAHVQD